MATTISDLYVGFSDAKHELEFVGQYDFKHGVFVPDNFPLKKFHTGEKFLIKGVRGAGKTTLLRWLSLEVEKSNSVSHFLLFKERFQEDRKTELDSLNISYLGVHEGDFVSVKDFKTIWQILLKVELADLLIRSRAVRGDTHLQKVKSIFDRAEGRSIVESLTSIFDGVHFYISDPSGYEGGVKKVSGPEAQRSGRRLTLSEMLAFIDECFTKTKIRELYT